MAAATTPLVRPNNRVLIASADSSFRKRLRNSPSYVEALSEEAAGGAHALAKLARFSCDSVLLDRNLPDLDSKEVADLIRRRYPQVEIEFVDSKSDSAALPAIGPEQEGASESNNDQLAGQEDEEGNAPTQRCVPEESAETLPGMLGPSRAMQQVYRLVRMVAARDTTVLITGATGTGRNWLPRPFTS